MTVAVCARRLALAVLLALLGWLMLTQAARAARERHGVEQLAAGSGRWVSVADAALHVQEWGPTSGPLLLLTHGTGAWSGTWFALPEALAAAGWRVVAVDLPPFGLSTTAAKAGTADYSRVAQARRVLALIDLLGRPVTLVGHSFGAGPALEAALQAGPRVRQLILVDPALGLGPAGEAPHCDPTAGPGVLLAHRPMRSVLVAASATWPGLSATLLRRFVHRQEVITDTLVRAYQQPFGRRGFSADLGDWAATFAQSDCEPAASLDASRLSAWAAAGGAPVRLVWGAQDGITPLAQAEALQRWLPGTTLDVIAGVGHIPHIEDPRAFAATLLGVLGPAR